MAQWYLSYDSTQYGPYDDAQAATHAAANPNGFAWREGFANWLPIREVGELMGAVAPVATTPAATAAPAPAAAQSPLTRVTAHEIDYKVIGSEMQFVEVELDPGESAIAEAGSMMYKDAGIEMQTIFGDGSTQGGGFMDKLMQAGKRVLTGESLFMTVFTHSGSGKGHVAFAAPYPGNILAMHLTDHNGRLICQKDSFLAAAKGVSIGIHFQKKILTGLFGGEGFVMQKLEGDGWVFVHAGGTVVERTLGAYEVLHVDTGCIVAFHDSVQFDIQQVGGIKSMLFGGEGMFFARLQGPGKVWLQSLPFSRLAGRMLQAAPRLGRGGREEGSVLGPLGGLLDGDNS